MKGTTKCEPSPKNDTANNNNQLDFVNKNAFPVNEVYTSNEKYNSNIKNFKLYKKMYEDSIKNTDAFWENLAKTSLRWFKLFTKVYLGNFKKGDVSWFINGKLNACENCVDRWAEIHPDKVAIIWEQDIPGEHKKITYKKLLGKVCKIANLLKTYGVKKQDTVTIYLPVIPELVYTVLACARLGAIHNVVFGGFSATSLSDRIVDSDSKILVTADLGTRGGRLIKIKQIADAAMDMCQLIQTCIVFKNKAKLPESCNIASVTSTNAVSTTQNTQSEQTDNQKINNVMHEKELSNCTNGSSQNNNHTSKKRNILEDEEEEEDFDEKKISSNFNSDICVLKKGRDVDGSALLKDMRPYCPVEYVDSEDILYVLYTSGSTGKPKGVAHTTAGYLLYAYTTCKYIFDVTKDDIFCCVADIGWVTGHSYVIYGPLSNGVTTVLFSSLPTYPDCGRYWKLIQTHQINQFYTAPTALRSLMKYGDHWVENYDLSTCRTLGTVGEPINPETWRWYYNVIGKKKCVIVDTYWQTETGGIVIAPIPHLFKLKPGSATLPFFGIELEILDAKTLEPLKGPNACGLLCIKKPWPGMLRTVYKNHSRLIKTYFSLVQDYYFTGDGAYRDNDGYYWISGRVDDTLNVSGHRIGAAEVEHALVQHFCISEAAVVSCFHPVKGEGILCFVVKKTGAFKNYGEENNVNGKNNISFAYAPKIENMEEFKKNYTNDKLIEELKLCVRQVIGPIATPDFICIVSDLPKTRSGKIIRRILRCIAKELPDFGDISTISNQEVIDDIRAKYQECKQKSAN